jgi:acyl carrier protein
MTRDDIFEGVKDVIREISPDTDLESVTEETSIVDDLDVDSLDVVEIIMKIEDAFEVKVADEDAQEWKNIGDVIDYIIEKQAS